MKNLTLHGITFNIDDGIEINQKLIDILEDEATHRIERPIIVGIQKDGKHIYKVASGNTSIKDIPSVKLDVNGIETHILRSGTPPVEIDEEDIAVALLYWVKDAFVSQDEQGKIDGEYSVDFD